jgi:hypothetical protein
MDTDRSSMELLGHFDRPKRVVSPDFDWDESDCGAAEFDPAEIGGSLGARCAQPQPAERCGEPVTAAGEPPAATVTAWCVVQWAAAVAVFAMTANVLFGFSQRLASERVLQRAARAGAAEAILPRASFESVRGTIERRAACSPALEVGDITLLQNGVPVFQQITENDGDAFSITVSARMRSNLPAWLDWLPVGRDGTQLTARAESRRPGRVPGPQKYLSATK